VQIADLADEIAYAAHDLEYALSIRLLNIDEILFEFKLAIKDEQAVQILERLVLDAKQG